MSINPMIGMRDVSITYVFLLFFREVDRRNPNKSHISIGNDALLDSRASEEKKHKHRRHIFLIQRQ